MVLKCGRLSFLETLTLYPQFIHLNELKNSSWRGVFESTWCRSPEDSHHAKSLWLQSKGAVTDPFQSHDTCNPCDTQRCLSLQMCVTLHLISGSCPKRKEKVELEPILFVPIQIQLHPVITTSVYATPRLELYIISRTN